MSDTDDTEELLTTPPDIYLTEPAVEYPYYNIVDSLINQVDRLENQVSDLSISMERVYPGSSHTTPQKPRTKFTLSSLPNSPNLKSEINPKLGDIDRFLSNVKLIKRLNAVRNLEPEFRGEKPFVKEKTWQGGEYDGSVPDLGFGMKKDMYSTSLSADKVDSDSGSESTQLTNKGAYDLGLLSLSEIWGSRNTDDSPSKFKQKLQEERMRRQHCEHAIKDLQNRVLELQEKVSVAIRVDEAKDKALVRIHDSWEKAGSRLLDSENERERLEKEVNFLKRKSEEEQETAAKKIAHFESESSKALQMVRGMQDKVLSLEKRYEEASNELKLAETNSEEFQKKYMTEIDKNKQYPEIIAQKELELKECKSILAEAREEVSLSKKAVEICQSELLKLKNENESLSLKLEEERASSKRLMEDFTLQKKSLKNLQEELAKSREQLDSSKLELKNFYQGQVEILVENKMKDFQKQLDDAENSLKQDLGKKEMTIARTAATHIQHISEKHSLEVKLLEEKHREECRLYKVQLSQLQHEAEESRSRAKRQQEKQAYIERQLHKFMESLKRDHVNSLDELNSFRSRSFTNLQELLDFKEDKDDEPEKASSRLTYSLDETPLSGRDKGGKRRENQMLQETIQMLLDKKPQKEGKMLPGTEQKGRRKCKPP